MWDGETLGGNGEITVISAITVTNKNSSTSRDFVEADVNISASVWLSGIPDG
jgi:hypothetical protein